MNRVRGIEAQDKMKRMSYQSRPEDVKKFTGKEKNFSQNKEPRLRDGAAALVVAVWLLAGCFRRWWWSSAEEDCGGRGWCA